ncbi:hypothetical protein AB0C02_28645 [Micromonospora sp. NPDC048999]|uniref:hypothetical protein n=1 Tax=Micromonospora sp. NPDC048999 TaxID=3155391 RepID=UPI0033DD165A
MVSAEGGTDEGHHTPLVKRRWLRLGRRLLFGLVVAVGSGHLLVLGGEATRREFSLSSFTLMWVSTAAGLLLLEWWDQRSQNRRPKPPRPQWRDDAPCPLVASSAAVYVYVPVTWVAGYTAAFDGQLKLVWADVLAATALALAASIRHWSGPYRMPENSEAAVGR